MTVPTGTTVLVLDTDLPVDDHCAASLCAFASGIVRPDWDVTPLWAKFWVTPYYEEMAIPEAGENPFRRQCVEPCFTPFSPYDHFLQRKSVAFLYKKKLHSLLHGILLARAKRFFQQYPNAREGRCHTLLGHRYLDRLPSDMEVWLFWRAWDSKSA